MHRIKQRIGSLIGNTPLLAINFTYKGEPRTIYAKAENLNMTGSIKDRMALHIINMGYERGYLKEGMPIFEATSGNTGISVAAIGRALGHPVTIYMPDWMSEERKNLIRSMGAGIHLLSVEEGGFLGSIDRANKESAEKNGFLTSQFSNQDNIEAHPPDIGDDRLSGWIFEEGLSDSLPEPLHIAEPEDEGGERSARAA